MICCRRKPVALAQWAVLPLFCLEHQTYRTAAFDGSNGVGQSASVGHAPQVECAEKFNVSALEFWGKIQ